VRHPLDVLVHDLGKEKLTAAVKQPLSGLKVACYYGCQLIRPYAEFDDQHNPTTMDDLMTWTGATTVTWPLKARCCGGSLTGTVPEVGLRLSYILVNEAKKRGADVIATACPLCQFNLECYQKQMTAKYGNGANIPVVYFTQLLGIALGVPSKKLGLHRLFVPFEIPRQSDAVAGGAYVRS
jgi:heterodisulfide reductase subunit B